MNFTHPAHQEMLLAMYKGDVKFILIGGYAVIYHGYIRTTGDMDIWLCPTNENKNKVIETLAYFIERDDLKEVEKLDFNEVVVFHIGDEPERIDFLNKVPGLNFNKALTNSSHLVIQGIHIPVLHLDDLIAAKLIADRPKDRADVFALQQINGLKM